MTPMRLTTWFRRRMAALVIASALVAWVALTLGYHLQKRRELILICRADAGYVAPFVAEAVQRRPLLWRYDGAKIADRLASQGVRPATAILVRDARGLPVDLGGFQARGGASLLWGHAAVAVGQERVADVWVGQETAALWRTTMGVALVAGLAAGLLAAMLYTVPVRTVARAEQRIVGLMSRLTLAMQEEERARIARDLHDGAGQAITAARLGLLALRKSPSERDRQAQLERIAEVLDGALDEVRRSSSALAPPALGELGLEGALRRHCEAFAAASGLSIECRLAPGMPLPAPHVQTECYRIVQEALANCARHAGARSVLVQLTASSSAWKLEVVDDGKGFDPSAARMGTGLQSIQERARLLGGTFELRAADRGTRLEVTFPNDGGDA